VPAAMDEDLSGPGELFEDESFAAKKTGAELLDQRHVELHADLSQHEGVALGEHATPGLQIEHGNPARIVARKADLSLTIAAEVGEKNGLARYRAAQGAEDLLSDRSPGHSGFPADVGRLINHLARFGVNFLSAPQLDAGHLEVIALNAVLERRRRRRRCRSVARCCGAFRDWTPAVRAEPR